MSKPDPVDRNDRTNREAKTPTGVVAIMRNDSDWGELKLPRPPAFPHHVLPPWLATFVAALARESGTSPDACAIATIGALGAAHAKRVYVRMRTTSDVETTNLWTLLPMPTGEGKSGIIRPLRVPFVTQEQAALANLPDDKALQVLIRREKMDLASVEKQMRKLKEAMPLDEADRETLDELGRQQAEHVYRIEGLKNPTRPLLLMSDTSPQALVVEMARQAGRIGMIEPEGSIFLRTCAQGGVESVLKAYSHEDIDDRKITRGTVVAKYPALSLVLATQPRVLNGHLGNHADTGFWERFIFWCPPPGIRDEASKAPADATMYTRVVSAALTARSDRTLTWSDDAEALRVTFLRELKDRQEGGDLSRGVMSKWAQKMYANSIRLAAILHVATEPKFDDAEIPAVYRRLQRQPSDMISREAMDGAIQILTAAVEHARHVLNGGVDGDSAFGLLDRLKRLHARMHTEAATAGTRADPMTFRHVQRTMGNNYREADVRRLLEPLIECNAVRVGRVMTGKKGAPSETVRLHPSLTEMTEAREVSFLSSPSESNDNASVEPATGQNDCEPKPTPVEPEAVPVPPVQPPSPARPLAGRAPTKTLTAESWRGAATAILNGMSLAVEPDGADALKVTGSDRTATLRWYPKSESPGPNVENPDGPTINVHMQGHAMFGQQANLPNKVRLQLGTVRSADHLTALRVHLGQMLRAVGILGFGAAYDLRGVSYTPVRCR